ncbi:MAG: metallophosphoesterase, partial [Pseudomonadota bacterium]
MIEKTFLRLRVLAEAGWHSAKQRFFASYDRVRTFFADLDAETRPERDGRRTRGRKNRHSENHIKQPARDARVPDDTRVYAIGDIHGRADLLKQLMDLIHADADAAEESRLVMIFLGDYVDRGFQSKDVIDYLLSDELSRYETYFLKGNHEAAFETFLSDPGFGPQWARFGGAETLMSYSIQPPRAKTVASEWEAVCEQLNRDLPMSHRNFLSTLSLYATLGDYVFVH